MGVGPDGGRPRRKRGSRCRRRHYRARWEQRKRWGGRQRTHGRHQRRLHLHAGRRAADHHRLRLPDAQPAIRLTSTVFNENEVLRAIRPAGSWPNGIVQMFYNDEHALTLGVRQVVVKSSTARP